jgi:serine/threonine-protein kinase
VFLTLLTVAYGRAGQTEKSQALLNDLNQLAKRSHVPLGFLAIIHAGLGHREQALDFLEKGYERKDTYMVRLKVSPWFDDLHSSPRFQTLLRKMDFPPDGQRNTAAGDK